MLLGFRRRSLEGFRGLRGAPRETPCSRGLVCQPTGIFPGVGLSTGRRAGIFPQSATGQGVRVFRFWFFGRSFGFNIGEDFLTLPHRFDLATSLGKGI